MKNLSIKKVLKYITISLLVLIGFYALITFCLSSGNLKNFSSELILAIINGFFLALAVVLVGIVLEENRAKEVKKEQLYEKLSILKNLLRNTFRRGKSDWNFSNKTQTFYFDNDWIIPLYDLLTHNNREWEVFIQEYKKSISKRNSLINQLSLFISKMDLALINAEQLDSELKSIKISPELSASLSSGYEVDRVNAKRNSEFKFWIIRATWAGANSTEIMFGFALFTKEQIVQAKIEGLSNEAITLGETKEFVKLLTQLKKDKENLSKKIATIKKLIN